MLKYQLLVILLISLFSLTASSQSDSVKVIIIDANEPDVLSPSTSKAQRMDRNYVYFNTYLVGRGAFVLGYERMLSPLHAVNASFGLTYRDLIYEVFRAEELTPDEVSPGTYFSVNYKLYPGQNLHYDRNIYLSPGFINRSYNLTQTVDYTDNMGNRVEENVDVGYNVRDLSFKIGYVYESRWLSDFIVDVYAGFGLRRVNKKSFDLEDINGPSDIRTFTEKDEKAAVYLGAKIGLIL